MASGSSSDMKVSHLSSMLPKMVVRHFGINILLGLDSPINLHSGFHAEKTAFLEIVKLLQFFCAKMTLHSNNYTS